MEVVAAGDACRSRNGSLTEEQGTGTVAGTGTLHCLLEWSRLALFGRIRCEQQIVALFNREDKLALDERRVWEGRLSEMP